MSIAHGRQARCSVQRCRARPAVEITGTPMMPADDPDAAEPEETLETPEPGASAEERLEVEKLLEWRESPPTTQVSAT